MTYENKGKMVGTRKVWVSPSPEIVRKNGKYKNIRINMEMLSQFDGTGTDEVRTDYFYDDIGRC